MSLFARSPATAKAHRARRALLYSASLTPYLRFPLPQISSQDFKLKKERAMEMSGFYKIHYVKAKQ